MASFRLRSYSAIAEKGKQTLQFLKKNPALPLSAASLGLVAHNTIVNTKARKQDMSYRTKQLEAMNKLTDKLNNVSSAVQNNTASLVNVGSTLNKTNDTLINYHKPNSVVSTITPAQQPANRLTRRRNAGGDKKEGFLTRIRKAFN